MIRDMKAENVSCVVQSVFTQHMVRTENAVYVDTELLGPGNAEKTESLVTCPDVSLIIGLGAYKLGKEDKWAGSAGEAEWIENPNIIQQQIELAEQSSASGYALYY